MENIFSFLIALLGLGFLVFIHELGHYIVAIKMGMRVETFSIGFGKPIFSFKVNKVNWQIGILPFGGYVRIAGMEKTGKLEPEQIKDGFYGKAPWKRILVASAGPIVNIAFALIVFSALYFLGGREQNFSAHTKIIGAVDPKSSIYAQKISAGDQIEMINGNKFQSFQDLLYTAILKNTAVSISGEKRDYFQGTVTPFSIKVDPYPISSQSREFKTIGITGPAQYLLYKESEYPSPIKNSGIQTKDRVVWANGELIFSLQQLSSVINDQKVLVTVKRGDKTFLTRVPRMKIIDLRLSQEQKEELIDRKHALKFTENISDLDFIPYEVNAKGIILCAIPFIDENAKQSSIYQKKIGQYDTLLKKGDKILSIASEPVQNAVDIFQKIQEKKVLLIVQREDFSKNEYFNNPDDAFIQTYHPKDLSKLISTIGLPNNEKKQGSYYLLNPVKPLTQKNMMSSKEDADKTERELERKIKEALIENDLKKKEILTKQLEEFNQKLYLGALFEDKKVIYNPSPWQQVLDVLRQTKTTFSYLFLGQISPKYLSGPVGIVQVIHHSVSLGVKEVLYWLALISLNLAIFNLLPLPILDGGHILMSIYEQITKKTISSRVKDLIMIPFFVLFVGFFIYVTFHDLGRVFTKFFQ